MKFVNLRFIFLTTALYAVALQSHGQAQYTETLPETGVSFEMVLVPAGEFLMGSSPTEAGRREDEGPQHRVFIDSLWVGKFEVTWDLFELFLAENRDVFSSLPDDKRKLVDAVTRPTPPFEDPALGMGRSGYPVVNVSPYAALTFCKWLTALTGRFYRLPTEAEWEYVCRAGSESAYSFGNDPAMLNEYAVYFENSDGQYASVGSKKPNSWGIYDLHGNVAEWTLDHYAADYYSTHTDKVVRSPWNRPVALYDRVYRGGSWDDDPEDLRSAARKKSGMFLQKDDPQVPKSFWWYTNSSHIGFRLVSPVNMPSSEELRKFWATVLDE
jgi:formylglycine-generating enzyme required for sulfatase activity